MMADGVEEQFTELRVSLARLRDRMGLLLEGGELLADISICSNIPDAASVHPECGSSRQRPNAAVQRKWFRYAPPQKETSVASRLRRCVDIASSEQRFDFGCYSNAVAILRVVEGFNAERVACEQKPFGFVIPKREREHSSKLSDHLSATIRIKLQ